MDDVRLDNPQIIEQTIKSHPSELEPLYWIMEDSIHSGNKSRAKACYMLLAYHAKYTPSLMATTLKPAYRARLKEVTREILTGTTTRQYQSIEVKYAIQKKQIDFKSESELRDYLAEQMELLSVALGETVKLHGVEVETEFGKCDLVVEGPNTFFPIELKTEQSNHKVVSQITKYVHHFYRMLRYNWYKPVQGVVIAPGFDSWSINELRKQGTWIFDVSSTNDQRCRLTRIP